jgi:nucleoside-diphosphate-sugar epimerase
VKLLITGADGFLGTALCARTGITGGVTVTAITRRQQQNLNADRILIKEISGETDWTNVLANQNVVIHAAARAYIMRDEVADPLAEYRRVNVGGTLNLARQAATAGVKRFIYISSIKVSGEQTTDGRLFTADDPPAPEDPYGISKWEAEQGLGKIAQDSGMEVVIIRPPLVYGPGVKGNFASLIKIAKGGLPLPLGAIHNSRALVGLDNLVDFILTCTTHPNAANKVFLVSDGEDLSTTALLQGLSSALGVTSRLMPIPSKILSGLAALVGKKAVAKRVLGSLQVDITHACELLDWKPPVSVEEGLKRCVEVPAFK